MADLSLERKHLLFQRLLTNDASMFPGLPCLENKSPPLTFNLGPTDRFRIVQSDVEHLEKRGLAKEWELTIMDTWTGILLFSAILSFGFGYPLAQDRTHTNYNIRRYRRTRVAGLPTTSTPTPFMFY